MDSQEAQFFCPTCGGSRFVAYYPVIDKQDVRLFRGEDGNPDPELTEYDGNVEMAEGSCGSDEEYQCEQCDWVFELVTAPDEAPEAS